jgi:hypothetical protein
MTVLTGLILLYFVHKQILNSTKLEIDALGVFPHLRKRLFSFVNIFLKFGLGIAAVTVKEKKRSNPINNVVFAH